MLIKLFICATLPVLSIFAASISEEIATTLIADEDTEKLGQTFQALRKEHGDDSSSWALVEVAKRGHPGAVARCLGTDQDLFSRDKMCVSSLVDKTLVRISGGTHDAESLAKVIASFKPADVGLFASIRDAILIRNDPVDVLKSAIAESPESIIATLPSWLASHRFDQNSQWYTDAREVGLKYLASFATESALRTTLAIVNGNEHYTVGSAGGIEVVCCKSQNSFPQDLIDKLNVLLELVQARNEIIRGILLSLLPKVIVELMLDYAPN